MHAIRVPMHDGRVLTLDLRETMSLPYFLTGNIWEEEGETDFFRDMLLPGDTVLDIGANVGWYCTLFADLVGRNGHVYAFEPNASAIAMLRATALQYQNLTVIDAAVADFDGDADLSIPDDGVLSSLQSFDEETPHQRCAVTSLDAFCDRTFAASISFIKCDAEGAELSILRGARRLMESSAAPVWMIEINEWAMRRFGYDAAALYAEFARSPAGYRGFRVNSQTSAIEALPDPPTFRFDAVFVPRSHRIFDAVIARSAAPPGARR